MCKVLAIVKKKTKKTKKKINRTGSTVVHVQEKAHQWPSLLPSLQSCSMALSTLTSDWQQVQAAVKAACLQADTKDTKLHV